MRERWLEAEWRVKETVLGTQGSTQKLRIFSKLPTSNTVRAGLIASILSDVSDSTH